MAQPLKTSAYLPNYLNRQVDFEYGNPPCIPETKES